MTGIGITDKEGSIQNRIFAFFYKFQGFFHALLADISANGHAHLPAKFFFDVAFIDPHPPGQSGNVGGIVPFMNLSGSASWTEDPDPGIQNAGCP